MFWGFLLLLLLTGFKLRAIFFLFSKASQVSCNLPGNTSVIWWTFAKKELYIVSQFTYHVMLFDTIFCSTNLFWIIIIWTLNSKNHLAHFCRTAEQKNCIEDWKPLQTLPFLVIENLELLYSYKARKKIMPL